MFWGLRINLALTIEFGLFLTDMPCGFIVLGYVRQIWNKRDQETFFWLDRNDKAMEAYQANKKKSQTDTLVSFVWHLVFFMNIELAISN